MKRADLVVRLFAAACRDVPARLILIGDGPDVPKARKEAARLGVVERVRFMGKQDQVVELLAAADVFVLPSLQESFGLAALEAMAAGIPVVASRVGDLLEVVGDDEGGPLHPCDDLDGMAGSLRPLCTDPVLRRTRGLRARERAFRLFSSERIVPQYEGYYQEVLARTRDSGWCRP